MNQKIKESSSILEPNVSAQPPAVAATETSNNSAALAATDGCAAAPCSARVWDLSLSDEEIKDNIRKEFDSVMNSPEIGVIRKKDYTTTVVAQVTQRVFDLLTSDSHRSQS